MFQQSSNRSSRRESMADGPHMKPVKPESRQDAAVLVRKSTLYGDAADGETAQRSAFVDINPA